MAMFYNDFDTSVYTHWQQSTTCALDSDLMVDPLRPASLPIDAHYVSLFLPFESFCKLILECRTMDDATIL
jgi:hypothetical protein